MNRQPLHHDPSWPWVKVFLKWSLNDNGSFTECNSLEYDEPPVFHGRKSIHVGEGYEVDLIQGEGHPEVFFEEGQHLGHQVDDETHPAQVLRPWPESHGDRTLANLVTSLRVNVIRHYDGQQVRRHDRCRFKTTPQPAFRSLPIHSSDKEKIKFHILHIPWCQSIRLETKFCRVPELLNFWRSQNYLADYQLL